MDEKANVLRDIFVGEIDFQTASGTIPLVPIPANVELPETGERIATADGFNVVYVPIETDKTSRVRKTEAVQAARRIEAQLGEDMILVMTNPGANQLHFIYPDFESPTPTLRRMVVERDLPRRTAVQQLSNCYYEWQERTLSQALKTAYDVEAVTGRFFEE